MMGDLRSKLALAAPLALAAALGCGARSGLDCFGERCALGEAGSGGTSGTSLEPDDTIGNAGSGFGSAGAGAVVPPEVEPLPPSVPPPPPPTGSAEPGCNPFVGVFDGSIEVRTQADLERLEGCNVVNGDLLILGLVTDDLLELSQLRSVTGTLQLALSGSLEGLQGLDSVGNLWLEGLDTTTLSQLGNLTRIGDGSGQDGALVITGLQRARDLEGFGNLRVVSTIDILESASLTSIAGLSVPPQLQRILLSGLDSLTDITALAPLEEVDELSFSDLNLTNLVGLANLRVASNLSLANLPFLTDLSQLAALTVVGGLYVEDIGVTNLTGLEGLERIDNATIEFNPNLLDMEALSGLTSLDELTVYANPALQSLPELRVEELFSVNVNDNAALQVGPRFPLATRIEFVNVSLNPALRSVLGFSALRLASDIVITNNLVLNEVNLGELQSARDLVVLCNPALPEAWLDPLRGVANEVTSGGNLGSTIPCDPSL